MPSFVKRIVDRVDGIEREQSLLQKEEEALGNELHQTLASRIGEELFEKLDRYAWSQHEQTLTEVLLNQTQEDHRPGLIVFEMQYLKNYELPDCLTELMQIVRTLELAWSDFVRIKTKLDNETFEKSDGSHASRQYLRVWFYLLEYDCCPDPEDE